MSIDQISDIPLDELEDHDRGPCLDRIVLGRRRMLAVAGGAGLTALLAACGSKSGTSAASTTVSASTATTATTAGTSPANPTATSTATGEIPEETAGPYPGDGTNGVDVLNQDGIVRSDITKSFGDYSGAAGGVPLTIGMSIGDVSTGKAMSGAAVYLWHADRDGKYSLYSQADQNYLRGVQAAAADGSLSFTSIFPACYDGRWPHIHFEVYASVDDAVGGGTPLATSQIALPEDICNTVYATEGYEQSVTNLAKVSLTTDNVFSDGVSLQTPTVSGDASGVRIFLPVAV